jgi:hypothetical protein
LTCGIQTWWDLPIGRVALKALPSGGAQHSIELYVSPLNVKGLPKGLYHYAADIRRLELLKVSLKKGSLKPVSALSKTPGIAFITC